MFTHISTVAVAVAVVVAVRGLCLRCFRRKHVPNKKEIPRIILDTDIGDDIDDAMAVLLLLLLHAKGVVEVVAVITSGKGNHQNRARLVSALARAVLVTVPILAGRQSSGTSKCNYMTAYPDIHAEETFPVLGEEERAWLLNIIADEHGKGRKVTILCIGLLDNLEYIQPPADSIILCLMGGCFGRFFDGKQAPPNFAEYNVFHSWMSWVRAVSTYTEVFIVPLDVAGLCRFPDWPNRLKECPVAYQNMYATWFSSPELRGSLIIKGTDEGKKSSIQFDPCALFLCLHPEAAVVREMSVEVTDKGVTRESDEGHAVRVATEWKPEGLEQFKDWTLGVLGCCYRC